ncbi:MAG: thiamine pyrophosphate-binding protein [Gemmatimonadota bacterium]|nr:thiamine pyrophosphate-binding protein [Gemmatimonadota bacterium]MDH5760946.1 thiamine pyrophosphate-binding protein [Gemmatimonadota bacterium]
MKPTGGRIVVAALEDEGIRHTFGIPGTHNIELYDALGESESVQAVLVTDEQSASFMADGAWRASGRMACVNVVPGAGLTHALSGIAEAFMDHVPLLVLGCGIRRDSGKAFQLHDVDQQALAAPVVKGTFLPRTGEELYATIREACALARRAPAGPVFVEVPADLYLFTHDVDVDTERERWGASGGAGSLSAPEGGAVDADVVRRVADILLSSRRTLLYVGAGAAHAADEVAAVAEHLQAPVSTTFQGKGVFPESHPLFLWPGFGAAAPPFVRKVAEACDVTLAVGCRFAEVGTGSYGLSPRGRLLHVDVDPDVLGRNFPAEVAVAADARAFLRALLAELRSRGDGRPPDPGMRAEITAGHAAVWEEWESHVGGERVTPAHLIRTAQEVFGPDAVYTTDSGNGTFLAMECLRLERPGRYLAPVDYSCMGYSVPAALGAGLALQDTPVVALAGDGAFLMTGLELLTAVREGIGAAVLVLRDRELAQIAQFQGTAMNRKVASILPDYELEPLAAALGLPFLRIDTDDQVEPVLRQAAAHLREGRPVLVDVAIDYSEKTYFTRGVVKANLGRLPLKDQVRFVGRALVRKVTG